MPDSDENRTSNERLGEQIVTKLLQDALIPETKFEEVRAKLVEGTARAEDWRLWIELAIPRTNEEVTDA